MFYFGIVNVRILIAFLCFCSISFSQELSFRSFSVREGLPQSQVFSIQQDGLGYLWMSTQGGGVCRFNGEEFETFTVKDGLLSNTVNELLVKGDSVLICSNKGLSIFSVKTNAIIGSIKSSSSIKYVKSFQSKIYLASDFEVFTCEKDTLIPIALDFSQTESRIEGLEIIGNEIWGVTSTGIYSILSNERIKVLGDKKLHFTCAQNVESHLLLGTYGEGLLVLSKDKLGYKLVKDTLEIFDGLIITTIYKDTRKNIWIGTQREGVFKWDFQDKKWENYSEDKGLSNDHVKTVFQDEWGQVWIGTSGGGVNQYSGSQFLHYTENSGLNGDYIYAVLKSKLGDLWVSTSGNGVMRINDTLQQVYNLKNGFQDVKVKAIHEDRRGLIWLGTEGKGLSVFYSRPFQKTKLDVPIEALDTFINFDHGKRFPSTLWVKSFAESSNGDIYISTLGNGLVRARVTLDTFPRISFTNLKIRGDQKLSERINDMYFDQSNDLVIGTADNGVGILKKGILSYYNSGNSDVPNKITSVEEGFNGEVWFGSDNGIGYIKNDTVWKFNIKSGLVSNNIYQIQKGVDGYMWIGTEKGVDRIQLLEKDQIEVKHFGADEGFTGIETSLNASFKDAVGNLWFGTVNGLSVYKPTKVTKTDLPPKIFFKSVKLFYDLLELKETALEYDQNSLSFSFDAVFLPNPKKVFFQWKLDGFDSEWSEPSRSKSITYSNLAPGNYVFYVRAGYGENWSEPIKFEFFIDKPYWEELWFKSLIWGGAIGLIVLIVVFFVFRSRKRGKALRKQLELEKSLIELEQKALRLQMNPHFIFNSLNTIQHLIIEKDEKAAKYYLSKFAKLMRQILENSRERLISIDDEVNTLENYLIIEKFSRSDFDYEIIVDDSIDRGEEILPPMMVQPFVENAIIHGLKGLKDRRGLIKISFLDKGDFLQFEIEDNGQGRMKAEEQKSQVANYHRSTALKVTQERLDNLNIGEDFKSFEIVDLEDSSGAPIGTKVILRVKF